MCSLSTVFFRCNPQIFMLSIVVLVNFTKKQINIAFINNHDNRYSVKQILVTLKRCQ